MKNSKTALIAEYKNLDAIMLRSILDVGFPFGQIKGVAQRMEQIERVHHIGRCHVCREITPKLSTTRDKWGEYHSACEKLACNEAIAEKLKP